MSPTTTSAAPTSPNFDAARPEHWLAYGFGAGLSPMAPGTIGTLVAIPLYLLLANLPTPVYVGAVVALIAVGVWACGKAVEGAADQDPPGIVWDEVVGFLVAMTAVPMGLAWIIMGFLLFRLFDIYKPWPVRWAQERFRGGLGIIADDPRPSLLTTHLTPSSGTKHQASAGNGALVPTLPWNWM